MKRVMRLFLALWVLAIWMVGCAGMNSTGAGNPNAGNQEGASIYRQGGGGMPMPMP